MGSFLRLTPAILSVAVLGSPVQVFAGPLVGDVQLGYVASSGNSDSENFSFASKLGYEGDKLSHKLSFDVFSGSQNEATSAERYNLAYQINTELTEKQSVFVRLDYDDDRFSGFDYQASATGGLTTKWAVPKKHTFSTDVGAGFRSSQFSAGGSEDEVIVRLAAAYTLQLTETAKFEQNFSTDIGEESTLSKAVSSFSVAIAESLSLAVSLHFKHFSEPVPGATSLDRETTVSLGYKF